MNGAMDYSFSPNGVPKVKTHVDDDDDDEKKTGEVRMKSVCSDYSGSTVKAQTLDELHSLQKKKSAPSTPKGPVKVGALQMSEEERQIQQLKSIR
jgi:phosphoenolpyruvate carboxykinase (ATP)